MARMPRGEPRSVIDPTGEAYDRAIQQHLVDLEYRERMEAARRDNSESRNIRAPIGHPSELERRIPVWGDAREALASFQEAEPIGRAGFVESLAPVWGSGREALADLQEGDYGGAALNTVMAVADVVPAKAVGTLLVKGGLKAAEREGLKAFVPGAVDALWKRTPPHDWKPTRKWAGETGLAEKGQELHHWAVGQATALGRKYPHIFNQPWNLKPMASPEVHRRIRSQVRPKDGQPGKPKFGLLESYWHGTPDWWKALNAGWVGKPAGATKRRSDERQ